jgi:succinate-acetate transporter protein
MAQYAAEPVETAAVRSANPAPLGLSAFALTTFVLSSANAGLIPPGVAAGGSIVIGLAFFYGGLAQMLAGMWEFRSGNTFGATAFTSYGAFWIALGFTLLFLKQVVPSATGVGFFLLGWTIFTGLMLLGTLRSNVALVLVFAFLFLTFLALSIGWLAGASTGWINIGGWLGIITALIAWYTALAGVLSSERSAFKLPVGPLA